MPLKKLVRSKQSALYGFQQTTLSDDALGRLACNSWEEVRAENAAASFDVVIIGAGLCGAYCAEKLYRRDTSKKLRILLVEAGAFLLPTHIQNLPRVQQTNEFGKLVWRVPWTGNPEFMKGCIGLAYCVGGRSLFWAGWSPELTENDLALWPQNVRNFLMSPRGYA
jgi:choline dehydrogenase-like flavoprotein